MSEQKSKRVVVTGAGRGLGLAFTRQWLEDGAEVCALARNVMERDELEELAGQHDTRLHRVECDVADDASVNDATGRIGKALTGVDVLVNNAGVYGDKSSGLESPDLDTIRDVFEVNTLGPLRVTGALLPLLRKGHSPRVTHITSLMGSIDDNTSGGSYPYRISKAALNMAGRNMAHELSGDDIVVVVMHPGWVRTDMGGSGAPLEIDDAVASMVKTIESLQPDHSGSFLDRNGERLPW